MKKLIYPALGLVLAFSVQSCMDNLKAKYLQEKTLADDAAIAFIKNGIEGGMTEIAASKLAVSHSTNPQVVGFAQMMIKDHSKIDSELKWIEFDKLITENDRISTEHQEKLDSLAKKSGAGFDKTYIAMMVKDHEGAVDLFTDATSNKNQTIQDISSETLPVIKMHLEAARQLETSLK